jgi:hypothetical protein
VLLGLNTNGQNTHGALALGGMWLALLIWSLRERRQRFRRSSPADQLGLMKQWADE